MKTILVLTDFTIKAECAAKFAIYLGIKNKANLLLCHAIEPDWQFADKSSKGDKQLALKKKSLLELEVAGNLMKKLIIADKGMSEPQITYLAAIGSLMEVTKNIIVEKKVDLVVAGNHRSNWLARLLFGSHIHSLIDQLDRPLLIVPEDVPYKGIKTIGYATDLSFDNTKAIDYLAKIAAPFEAALSINYVSPRQFPDKTGRSSEFSLSFRPNRDHPLVAYHHIKADDIKSELLALTRSKSINILALVHRRYKFFGKIFHQSICASLAYRSRTPLLILPDLFSLTAPVYKADLINNYSYEVNLAQL
jgi:nucleotide-binding universal stress UspA family protein